MTDDFSIVLYCLLFTISFIGREFSFLFCKIKENQNFVILLTWFICIVFVLVFDVLMKFTLLLCFLSSPYSPLLSVSHSPALIFFLFSFCFYDPVDLPPLLNPPTSSLFLELCIALSL